MPIYQKEKIIEKLNQMYNEPKSKKFVLHLIHAYMPVEKASSLNVEANKTNLKCAITGQSLISAHEALNIAMKEDVMNDMIHTGVSKAIPEHGYVSQGLLQKELNGRVLAYTGEETTTVLCEDALRALYDFTMARIMNADPNVNYIITKHRYEANKNYKW